MVLSIQCIQRILYILFSSLYLIQCRKSQFKVERFENVSAPDTPLTSASLMSHLSSESRRPQSSLGRSEYMRQGISQSF
jgi:hypothetical protein